MCEEKKIPQEINEDDLDKIAGGAAAAVSWRCAYCGNRVMVSSNAEIIAHYQSCAKSPYNPANK